MAAKAGSFNIVEFKNQLKKLSGEYDSKVRKSKGGSSDIKQSDTLVETPRHKPYGSFTEAEWSRHWEGSD